MFCIEYVHTLWNLIFATVTLHVTPTLQNPGFTDIILQDDALLNSSFAVFTLHVILYRRSLLLLKLHDKILNLLVFNCLRIAPCEMLLLLYLQ